VEFSIYAVRRARAGALAYTQRTALPTALPVEPCNQTQLSLLPEDVLKELLIEHRITAKSIFVAHDLADQGLKKTCTHI